MWSAAPSANGLGGRWLVFDRDSGAQGGPAINRFHEDTEARDRLLPQFQQMSSLRRAIVAFPETLHGRPHYFQAQLRWASPARDRMTSFVAFAVDAERLRSEFFPTLVAARVSRLQQPTGFPPPAVTLADDLGRIVVSGHGEGEQSVDERTFPLVFFDKELLRIRGARRSSIAKRGGCARATATQTIPEIVGASTRPQRAMMVDAGRRHGARRLLRRAAPRRARCASPR